MDNENLTEARREFFKAAGRLAIYTPPVMMLLAKPSTNAIAASAGVPDTSAVQGASDVQATNQANPQVSGGFWLWRLLGIE